MAAKPEYTPEEVAEMVSQMGEIEGTAQGFNDELYGFAQYILTDVNEILDGEYVKDKDGKKTGKKKTDGLRIIFGVFLSKVASLTYIKTENDLYGLIDDFDNTVQSWKHARPDYTWSFDHERMIEICRAQLKMYLFRARNAKQLELLSTQIRENRLTMPEQEQRARGGISGWLFNKGRR